MCFEPNSDRNVTKAELLWFLNDRITVWWWWSKIMDCSFWDLFLRLKDLCDYAEFLKYLETYKELSEVLCSCRVGEKILPVFLEMLWFWWTWQSIKSKAVNDLHLVAFQRQRVVLSCQWRRLDHTAGSPASVIPQETCCCENEVVLFLNLKVFLSIPDLLINHPISQQHTWACCFFLSQDSFSKYQNSCSEK